MRQRLLRMSFAGVALALAMCLLPPVARAARGAAGRIFGLVYVEPVVQYGPCLLSFLLTPDDDEHCAPWSQRESAGPAFHVPASLVLVGGSDGLLHAMDAKTGRVVYRKKLPGALVSQPQLLRNDAFFGTDNGHVMRVDVLTGAVVWDVSVDAEVIEPVRLDDGVVYAVTGLDSVYAFDQANGEPRWVHKEPLPPGITLRGQARPGVTFVETKHGPEKRVFAGHASGRLMILDPDSGQVIDQVDLARGEAFNDIDTDPVFIGDQVVVASHAGGIFALGADELRQRWNVEEKGIVRLAPGGPNLLIAAGAGKVLGLDAFTGQVRWRFTFDKGAPTRIVVQGGRVHVASDAGSLYVLDLFRGKPLQYHGSGLGFAGDLELTGDALFALSTAGHLHALSSDFRGQGQRGQ